MAPTRNVDEVGQVIVVAVRVVDETALLDQQLPRVDAGAVPAVPAQRALAAGLLDGLDSPPDMVALLLAAEQPVLDPAPAVRAGLVTALPQPRGHLRVALERDRGGEECRLDPVLVEQLQ